MKNCPTCKQPMPGSGSMAHPGVPKGMPADAADPAAPGGSMKMVRKPGHNAHMGAASQAAFALERARMKNKKTTKGKYA